MTFRTPKDALAHDLWFALTFKTQGRLRRFDEAEVKIVARSIVDYLELANWKFERGTGLKGHSELGSGPPK
jgi:hypothetical protein